MWKLHTVPGAAAHTILGREALEDIVGCYKSTDFLFVSTPRAQHVFSAPKDCPGQSLHSADPAGCNPLRDQSCIFQRGELRLLRRCYRGETKDGPLSLLGQRRELQGTSCHLPAPCGQRCPHSSVFAQSQLSRTSSPDKHPAPCLTPSGVTSDCAACVPYVLMIVLKKHPDCFVHWTLERVPGIQ